MKKPSFPLFTILAGVTLLTLCDPSSGMAQVLLNESFSGSSMPPGWTTSMTAGTQAEYTLGSGITFSDANPVASNSTSIVVGTDNTRGTVNFLYTLPTAAYDFEATMSFTWDQAVGPFAAKAATPTLYLSLFNNASVSVVRAGIYDNWRTDVGAYYGIVNGNTKLTAAGTLPTASGGTNTITIKREGEQISILWLDQTGATVYSHSGTSSLPVNLLYIQVGMLRIDSSGVNTTKLGALTIQNVTFEAIPEPGTISLTAGCGIAFGLASLRRRHKKQ